MLIGIVFAGLLSFGIYLLLAQYYQQRFMLNTWINGVYCTGKNVEEVNKELLNLSEAPFLSITDKSGREYRISTNEFNYTVDFKDDLQKILDKQNIYQWPKSILIQNRIELIPHISLKCDALQEYVKGLDFFKEDYKTSGEVKISLTDEGYVLMNTLRERIDAERLFGYLDGLFADETYLLNGYTEGIYAVCVDDADCYMEITLNEEQQKTMDKWMAVQSYIHNGIIYDMGDQMLSLSGKIASSFIQTDEQGEILFDENNKPIINDRSIETFINSLADEYNTWKGELIFQSTTGEEKVVPYVNYGTQIDVKKEIVYLKQAFREKRIEVHVPAYVHEGYVRGKNDIGDTYIEVDMGNQKLYAYLDGQLLVDTDIVTGNMKNRTSTPEGVVYVYAKQRNRTLRGPGYAAFVKYWMPVKGGIGLHDANWRSKFGGEIYKKNGSHGCINIPRSVMQEIYENFEIGTPVIMFY